MLAESANKPSSLTETAYTLPQYHWRVMTLIMEAYLQMLKMEKWHQVHRAANRNMCHHRFVPPPVAYGSWDMLMTSIPVLAQCPFPKPSLSINYGQDEIRVPIRQPFISRSQGDPARRNVCFFSLMSHSERERGMQGSKAK